jgi:hypothetical protein
MSHQHLSREDAMNINLMLAHVRCLSELVHTLPEHRFQFKSYFKKLFTTVKEYEEALNKMTNYNEDTAANAQQQAVYDALMDLTYEVREIILNKKDDGNT